jgi:hypothetical protein
MRKELCDEILPIHYFPKAQKAKRTVLETGLKAIGLQETSGIDWIVHKWALETLLNTVGPPNQMRPRRFSTPSCAHSLLVSLLASGYTVKRMKNVGIIPWKKNIGMW